jgi:hypothetical protein
MNNQIPALTYDTTKYLSQLRLKQNELPPQTPILYALCFLCEEWTDARYIHHVFRSFNVCCQCLQKDTAKITISDMLIAKESRLKKEKEMMRTKAKY